MTLISFLATSLALAGDTVHEVELRGGIHELVRADRMLSAVPHHGAAPSFDLSWSPRGPRMAHLVELSFTPTTLASGKPWSWRDDGERRETGRDAAVLVDLQYAIGARIDAGEWTLHVGGTVANQFENLATNYGFLGMESYLGVLGAGPWVDLRRGLGERHTLELQAYSPVVSWVARNPYAVHSGQHVYNTRDNKPLNIIPRYLADGSVQTLNHIQAIHLRAGYAFDLSDTFALVARGRVDGFHLSVPHPMVEWRLGMNLGIRGRF